MSTATRLEKAPAFALVEPLTGKTVSSTDFAGRAVLVVVFTCNHCPYALAWEERILALGAEFGQRIGMVLINANDPAKQPADSPEAMVEHAREHAFTVPYLFDAEQSVARAFGAQRTPEAFVFNAKGDLAYHGTIDDNYEEASQVTAAYLRDAIEATLAGRAAPVAETAPKGCTIKWRT